MPTSRLLFDQPEVYQWLSTQDGTYPPNGEGPFHSGSGIQNGGTFSQSVGTTELRDGDDSTYAAQYHTVTSLGISFRAVDDGVTVYLAPEDALNFGSITVNSVTAHIRLSGDYADDDGSLNFQLLYHDFDSRDGFGSGPGGSGGTPWDIIAGFSTDAVISDAAPEWHDFGIASGDLTAFVQSLADQSRVLTVGSGAETSSTSLSYSRIYEGYLEFDYTPAERPDTAVTFTRPAALRVYPRSDGLGASSARRIYPPPRSIQRSNRRAGGYL